MSDPMRQNGQPQVGTSDLVRLLAPIEGPYCKFAEGEIVKIKRTAMNDWRVERAEWLTSCTIFNVLVGVPNHVLCYEPNGALRSGDEAL